MSNGFQVTGQSATALFTLKIHRGDGMALLAMDWKNGQPPDDFVGFAIEYQEPGSQKVQNVWNRLNFLDSQGRVDRRGKPTRESPIQMFRWVHFPFNADKPGDFIYRVTPVFMDADDQLSYGDPQEAPIELRRETYPSQLNVAFTRGFVSSQAFVDKYERVDPISKLLPAKADDGLKFKPTHAKAEEALAWMSFEAREVILEVLDQAVADDTAQVRVVAYDLSEPEVVSRLEKLGSRLKIIIDDEGSHGNKGSGENQAQKRLEATAGPQNVMRQHMSNLQHNKTIAVEGQGINVAVCGSTNFSWRGFYVQSNNALVVHGKSAVRPFWDAFDAYWTHNAAHSFTKTGSAAWIDLGLNGIDAKISFSPHSKTNALLNSVAKDIEKGTTSSLFYSLAFLSQTPGPILNAITKVTNNKKRFVYGIADKKMGGLILQKPNGNLEPLHPEALSQDVPEPFKAEPVGGGGIRMHHKFVVIDFDKPTARVYVGSYNFSTAADTKNGDNLLLIRDRRIAVSYAIEALTMIDHYHFRVKQQEAAKAKKAGATQKALILLKPPRKPTDRPWWLEYYTDAHKIRDRELFA